MSTECIKVIVRCRPLNDNEHSKKSANVVDIKCNLRQCTVVCASDKKKPPKTFSYDAVYDEKANTDTIYAEIAYPLVEKVTEGYNGTVFAYGQTGCGKSYTMQGLALPDNKRGIIPRAFEHIFETISVVEGVKFLVHASFLEIYNEEIRDLLSYDQKNKLELKEHPDRGIFVAGLTMHKVSSVKDCQRIMNLGWKNRATGATLMNTESSRSHSIFTIHLEMITTDKNAGRECIRVGKLNLVDLAGSERQSKTGAAGERFKEATKINLSLSALGNVISALVDSKGKHIPYRDSKLTRLLQDSLGGNTKTLMIACISPADTNYEETLSTLRYANRAKNIKNKPKINEDPKDAMLREYQEEIRRLRELLSGQPQPFHAPTPAIDSAASIEAERERIRESYEKKLREREQEYEISNADKNKLCEEMARMKAQFEEQLRNLELKNQKQEPVLVIDRDGEIVQKRKGEDEEENGLTPRNLKGLDRNALIKRLQELEAGMLGGESVGDAAVNERHKQRTRMAELKLKELLRANEHLEDEGIMVGIYASIQDELRAKSQALAKEQRRNEELESEIRDLMEEFEAEREEYLDIIRRQDRRMNLLQAILDKVQPCIRRDSNYADFELIKRTAKYDEEAEDWILPALTAEKTHLPPTRLSEAALNRPPSRKLSAQPNILPDAREARLLAKLSSVSGSSHYFQNGRRASELLLRQRNSANSDKSRQYANQSRCDD